MNVSPSTTTSAAAFNPCAIIPVFNHQQKIAQVLLRLHEFNLPCIVIDDGSDAECAQVLNDFTQQHDWISLQRLAKNSGKGAAVCHGLAYALLQGYSHALQVDADGQHDLNDVPLFLTQAEQHPTAVISGWRSYDAMPPGRRSGRKLTDFWVRVNTLSAQIKDSMCGYRLYPLLPTMALLQHKKIGARMDFDTDILVRLYWQGLAVKNLPTKIVYQDDIPSHFHMFTDNVRITWMHTRLFFGMLLRIPRLLKRHQAP
ncbi:MAG: glycosyltransferase family 2 protein [Pseudomonadota bacterium]